MHSECASKPSPALHPLNDTWTMYAHLPHETDWSLSSYKNIGKLDNVESVITLAEFLPDKLIRNCMLFVMKEDIKPIWEDEKNLNEATARIFMNKIVNLSNNRGGYSIVKEVYESEQNLLMGILELCDELGLKISIKKELFVLGLEKYDTEIMGYCEALNWPARYYSWGGELDELRIISHVLEVESYSDEMMGCVLCSLFPVYYSLSHGPYYCKINPT
mgnify:CR=1 FL=1